MFQGIKKLFGGKKEEGQILAPVAGQAVPLSEVPDLPFARRYWKRRSHSCLWKMNLKRLHPER